MDKSLNRFRQGQLIYRRKETIDDKFIESPRGLPNVSLTERFVEHVIHTKRGEHREQFADFIIPTLENPGEVWEQTETFSTGRRVVWDVFLGAFTEAKIVLVARKDARYGDLAWTFYAVRKFRDRHRQGRLLYWRDEYGQGRFT